MVVLSTNGIEGPKGNYGLLDWKCQSDEVLRNKKVERGKPRKRETQILVGEPNKMKMNVLWDRVIDR